LDYLAPLLICAMTAQWMWADVGPLGNGVARRMPWRWSKKMPFDVLLRELTETVPFEERQRPVRLRVGSEEVLCGSVDEARSRLTGRRVASREDWKALRTVDGKRAWVNLRDVLREEKARLLKEQQLDHTVFARLSAEELLAEGLRRRNYVVDAEDLVVRGSSVLSSQGGSTVSAATIASAATTCELDLEAVDQVYVADEALEQAQ